MWKAMSQSGVAQLCHYRENHRGSGPTKKKPLNLLKELAAQQQEPAADQKKLAWW